MKYDLNEKVIAPDGTPGVIKDYMERSNCYNVYFEDIKMSLWLEESCLKATEIKQYTIDDFIGGENEKRI